jgi:hypothetical protein
MKSTYFLIILTALSCKTESLASAPLTNSEYAKKIENIITEIQKLPKQRKFSVSGGIMRTEKEINYDRARCIRIADLQAHSNNLVFPIGKLNKIIEELKDRNESIPIVCEYSHCRLFIHLDLSMKDVPFKKINSLGLETVNWKDYKDKVSKAPYVRHFLTCLRGSCKDFGVSMKRNPFSGEYDGPACID